MDNLYNWNDMTKIGVATTGLGLFFTFLGIMMFLDRAMLTLGNMLFVAGVVLVMGPDRFKTFFFQQKRLRASACFFIGIFLVMFGYCFLGLLIQGFGTLNLFANFFPMIVRVLEVTPVVGKFMNLDVVQSLLEKLSLGNTRNV